MKCKLQFSQTPNKWGFVTKLERIKILDNEGKYLKWGPHNSSIMEHLQTIEIELPDTIDIQSKNSQTY